MTFSIKFATGFDVTGLWGKNFSGTGTSAIGGSEEWLKNYKEIVTSLLEQVNKVISGELEAPKIEGPILAVDTKGLVEYINWLEKVSGASKDDIAALDEVNKELFDQQSAVYAAATAAGVGEKALTILAEGFFGAGTAAIELWNRIQELPPWFLKIAEDAGLVDYAIGELAKTAKNPIEIYVNIVTSGLEEVTSEINGLVNLAPIPVLIKMEEDYQDKIKAYQKELASMTWLSDRERQLMMLAFIDSIKTSIGTTKTAWQESADAAKKAAKDAEDAFKEATGTIKGYIDEGVSFSKGLGDLTPNIGEGPLAPGANGPFEDIYRLKDIAMSALRGKGPDTDKWAAAFGLTPEAAKEIVLKFEAGLWFDPDVSKYINTQKLKEIYDAEMLKGAGQSKFIDDLAKQLGIPTEKLTTMMAKAVGETGTAVAKTAATGLSTALDTAIKGSDTAGQMIGFGTTVWGQLEAGILAGSKTSTVFQTAIQNAINSYYANRTGASGVNLPQNAQVTNTGNGTSGTTTVTLNIQPGAIQITSDDPMKIGDEIISVIFQKMSKAESEIGIPATNLMPGAR